MSPRPIRILLTAFEPWGEWTENSSRLCLRAVEEEGTDDLPVEIRTRVYPVDSRSLRPRLRADLRRRPDFAVHLGQDARATGVKIETVGLNLLVERGETARPIVRDGPLAHRVTLPAARWVRRLRREGIPASVSYHAGTYLCNAALYLSLHRAEGLGLPTRSVFVHLPLESSQACGGAPRHPSLPVETTARAVRLLIEDLARKKTGL